MYDVVIVGAGMSGLYTAYRIKKKRPSWRVAVLERADHVGGRAGMVTFHGTPIQIGAGIGRYPYDTTLLHLCKELGLQNKLHKFDHVTNYSVDIPYPVDMKAAVKTIRHKYRRFGKHRGMTFQEVALDILGPEKYQQFKVTAGYTDWEKEDPEEALRTLRIDDDGWDWSKAVYIPWNDVLQGMVQSIGPASVHCQQEVIGLKKEPNSPSWTVQTRQGTSFHATRVIVSTDIRDVLRLVPGARRPRSLYHDVQPMPFLRVYAHFDAASREVMKHIVPHITVVATPLYKIIPSDADKGVYMIAYTDNAGARYYMRGPHRKKLHSCSFWAKEVERALHLPAGTLLIDDLSVHDWPVGTHYFRPLLSQKSKTRRKTANRPAFLFAVQHPQERMWVVGEGMSRDQGWTEGALDSVHAVLEAVVHE